MITNVQANQKFHLSTSGKKINFFLISMPYGFKHILCMPIINYMSACFDQLCIHFLKYFKPEFYYTYVLKIDLKSHSWKFIEIVQIFFINALLLIC
jgi:hypothetical protein